MIRRRSDTGFRADAVRGSISRVALWATVTALIIYIVACCVADLLVASRLDHSIDTRLSSHLTEAIDTLPTSGPISPIGVYISSSGGDFDDAPVVIWWIPSGALRAVGLDTNAPTLPASAFAVSSPVDATVGGHAFRLAGRSIGSRGRLVAGTSTGATGSAISTLLAIEAGLAPIALITLYVAAWLIGRRAANPIERAHRQQLEFTADASHELRTPLSVIETEVGLALNAPRTNVDYRTALERIAGESKRLRAIVEDLLWLSRFESLPDDPPNDAVDLSVVALACVDRFTPMAARRGIELTFPVQDLPNIVFAPADWLDRLVSVLVDNACRYANDSGTIAVSTTQGEEGISLTVEDSGPGVSESEREDIFRRFHRGSSVPGGAGLGLSIANAIVLGTGGSWNIATSHLGGARMTVSWPPPHTP